MRTARYANTMQVVLAEGRSPCFLAGRAWSWSKFIMGSFTIDPVSLSNYGTRWPDSYNEISRCRNRRTVEAENWTCIRSAELADWPAAKDTGGPLCPRVTREAISHYTGVRARCSYFIVWLPLLDPPNPSFVEQSERVCWSEAVVSCIGHQECTRQEIALWANLRIVTSGQGWKMPLQKSTIFILLFSSPYFL